MSKPGFIAGFAGAGILSVLMKFLGYVVRFLSTIMLYFGLYVPFFYFLYGLIIHLTLGVVLFDFSTNSQLYLLGLLLCLVSSVIISVRNIILTPLKSALKFYDSRKRPENRSFTEANLCPTLSFTNTKTATKSIAIITAGSRISAPRQSDDGFV